MIAVNGTVLNVPIPSCAFPCVDLECTKIVHAVFVVCAVRLEHEQTEH